MKYINRTMQSARLECFKGPARNVKLGVGVVRFVRCYGVRRMKERIMELDDVPPVRLVNLEDYEDLVATSPVTHWD